MLLFPSFVDPVGWVPHPAFPASPAFNSSRPDEENSRFAPQNLAEHAVATRPTPHFAGGFKESIIS